ncbi:MAG: D-alanyl-D-alanine carboxypeptidase [Prevotella sp.]|nr:D-alanyl-D-alanine carboxypeptidase [Prevotella sp.]
MKQIKRIVCAVLSAAVMIPFAPKAGAVSLAGLSAKAAVLIDAQTGTVIAEKNEKQRLPMASTTKIMSALLLLESGGLDEQFRVDNQAIMVEGSSMGLCEDDIVTKRALCYGMLLPSGNDAANQTAATLAGSTEKFAEMMNSRAKEIGLGDTNFVTPSGLHDENHYSTAYDMAILTREALKNEDFREICGTKRAKLKFGNPPYERWLVNTNKLLTMYDGCIGVKTGFTDEAGRCLVSAAEKNGVTLICVTLNASDDWNDHKKMYDYGFSAAESRKVSYDCSGLTVKVAGGTVSELPVELESVPDYTVVNGEEPVITSEIFMSDFLYAPAEKGKKAGIVNFYSDGKPMCTVNVVTKSGCGAVAVERKPNLYEIILEKFKHLID